MRSEWSNYALITFAAGFFSAVPFDILEGNPSPVPPHVPSRADQDGNNCFTNQGKGTPSQADENKVA